MRPLLIIFFALTLFAFDNQPGYHSVKAAKGDGAYSILRRYQLPPNTCNLSKFFELNGLNKNSSLQRDVKYLLPVKIVQYNGKSIRSTLNISDLELAKKIKQYNEDILARGLRKTHYTTSNILWVPHYLINCNGSSTLAQPIKKSENTNDNHVKTEVVKSKNVASSRSKSYSIFGEKYANTPLIDNTLAGQVFYIVSGHGGPDPGAMTKIGSKTICEDEYAYDVALRLSRKLIQHGAIAHVVIRDENDGIRDEAYLNCDKDEVSINGRKLPLNQTTRLRQRVHDINKLYGSYKKKGYKEQYCIALHVDSRHKDKRTDLYFYHHEKSKSSKELCSSIFDVFKSKYAKYRTDGRYEGSISSRNLHMIRETYTPTVYIEMGNLRNALDQKRFLIHSNREALADWITEGILKYKKTK